MMHKRMWELKQSASPGTLDLYIYGDVESDDPGGWFSDPKESETSANALRDALAQQPNAQQINLYINSYGGSVFEGTASITSCAGTRRTKRRTSTALPARSHL